MKRPMKWWERFQIQLGVNFQLVPSGQMSWREWAFDPSAGVTWPGQKITSRTQLPESSSWCVDTLSIEDAGGKKGFRSRVFWVRGALRVLGLDFGVGVFWRISSDLSVHRDEVAAPQLLSQSGKEKDSTNG